MAAPIPLVVVSRNSGRLPLAVFFDASGTTDADTTKPFHDLYYEWNFGDVSAGNWERGANTSLSKNGARGPVAAHVYEAAGTYTWHLRVFDGTTWAYDSDTITVSDWPDDANTVCIGNTLPVAGVNGVPDNATCASGADFEALIAAHVGANKRILFDRAGTFTSIGNAEIAVAGPGMVGAFGVGAGPIVNLGAAGVRMIQFGTNATDWRIVDIQGDGQSNGTTRAISSVGATTSKITILRLGAINMNNPIGLSFGDVSEVVIQDSVISHQIGVSGGNGIFYTGSYLAVIGCDVSDSVSGEHILRIQGLDTGVIAHNRLAEPAATKLPLTIRGFAGADGTVTTVSGLPTLTGCTFPAGMQVGVRISGTGIPSSTEILAFDIPLGTATMSNNATASGTITAEFGTFAGRYSENIVVSNNSYEGGAGVTSLVQFAPQNESNDERIRNVVSESNIYKPDAATSFVVLLSGSLISVRNELFIQTVGAGFNALRPTQTGIEPLADQLFLTNNTMYSAAASGTLRLLSFGSSATNVTLRNNLGYAPLGAGGDLYNGTPGANFTESNNSSDANITGNNPLFEGPLTSAKGFRYATNGYGQNAGTALFPSSNSDFFNCDDVTANVHIGAMVPRARATCRGVK
jgi:hypothetical protein